MKLSERLLFILFGMAPLFLVTVRSWSSFVLIVSSFFSLVLMISSQRINQDGKSDNLILKNWMIVALIAPVCAIALSSFFRGRYAWSDYDSASRFLLAVAIFLFALHRRVNIVEFLQYSAPCSLVVTLLHQTYFPQPQFWGGRMATYFSDPLVFGYTSLTLGLISLVSINLLKKDSKSVLVFKLLGVFIGFYLSIKSGSRTGWLAVPFLICIWLYFRKISINKWSGVLVLAVLVALVFAFLAMPSSFYDRFSLAFQEVRDYPWVGIAPETSIGLRITFLRIAFDLFASHPILGFGDTRYELLVLPSHVHDYASPESIRFALTAGFHNEIVTNAIRFGVFGLLASLMLFAVPLFVFFRQLNGACFIQRANALVGVVFCICIFVSSLSTEVFDLKYTASFYALMISLLCASSIASHKSKSADGLDPERSKHVGF
jgi:O-antigen ligase